MLNLNLNKDVVIAGIALAALGIASFCAGYFFYHNLPASLNFKLFGNDTSSSELNKGFVAAGKTANLAPHFLHTSSSQADNKQKIEFGKELLENLGERTESFGSTFFSDNHDLSSLLFNSVMVPFFNEAMRVSLDHFLQMSEAERLQTIEKFQIQNMIEEIGNEKLFNILASIDRELLQQYNLVDLKLYNNRSALKYILKSDDEINKLLIKELEDLSNAKASVINHRIKKMEKGIVNDVADILEAPLSQFIKLSGSQINTHVNDIPSNIFTLITDEQFQSLDLTKLDCNQLANLFIHGDNKKRFSSISIDINQLLENLSPSVIRLITSEQIVKL